MSSLEILDPIQSKITENLNENQRAAVLSVVGSTLVIAGAGSGKTAVLTRRVAYLISKNVLPGQILCLTFTNKAAGEMNKRVRQLLESVDINLPYNPPWREDYLQNPLLCTFHSLGVRVLREFGDKIGLKKEFNILDMDDQKKIFKDIIKQANIDEKSVQPNLLGFFISQCKQELLTASESRKLNKEFLPIFHQMYAKYEERLKASHVVDFDDLLMYTYILLRDHADVRQMLQARWHHLMIDEFQDTNQAQFEIVKLLVPYENLISHDFDAESSRSLFVVGDDAQSIYAFRGSKISIILNFEQDYPNTREIMLNQNYRSTQPILDLAEQILTHNPNQKKKNLFTQNHERLEVNYYLARNDRDEAEYIIRQLYNQYCGLAETSETKSTNETNDEVEFEFDESFSEPVEISRDISSNDPIASMFDMYLDSSFGNGRNATSMTVGVGTYNPSSWQVPQYNWSQVKQLNNCAVLYRTHAQSRSLEEIFLKYNLPYRLISGTRFLDRKEIKDVLAILKYLSNGEDKVSLNRFLPLLIDGAGPKTMEKIMAYLEDFEYPLAPKFASQVLDLFSKMQSVWANHTSLIDLTKELLTVSGYFRYLKNEYPVKEEFQTRTENIGELYSIMYAFDTEENMSLRERLNEFLAQVGLMSQQDANETDQDTPKINLMSLHQSKGLEFETVFLVGVEDGILPHQNSFFEPNGFEEEVRLAYVGVTRAKKYLHLISCDSRISYGQVKANPVSRIFRPFLDTYVKRVKR